MIKIAITGPESTGKSALAKSLAEHFKVEWAREFARDYLNEKDGKYSMTDLDEIADGQWRNIESLKNQEVLIADTEMSVIKIWSEFKYGECSEHISQLWEQQHFDLYLLCAADIPFEEDPLRENEAFRDELFEIYSNVLAQMKANFVVLKGDQESRLQESIKLIEELLR